MSKRIETRNRHIPLTECLEYGIYLLNARNLTLGVYDGDRGFIGVRHKMGSEVLFTEYHWDQGAPFGTASPRELVGFLNDDIRLRETEEPVCGGIRGCGRSVVFDTPKKYESASGEWLHCEGSLMCESATPVYSMCMSLFDFLKSFAKKLP